MAPYLILYPVSVFEAIAIGHMHVLIWLGFISSLKWFIDGGWSTTPDNNAIACLRNDAYLMQKIDQTHQHNCSRNGKRHSPAIKNHRGQQAFRGTRALEYVTPLHYILHTHFKEHRTILLLILYF